MGKRVREDEAPQPSTATKEISKQSAALQTSLGPDGSGRRKPGPAPALALAPASPSPSPSPPSKPSSPAPQASAAGSAAHSIADARMTTRSSQRSSSGTVSSVTGNSRRTSATNSAVNLAISDAESGRSPKRLRLSSGDQRSGPPSANSDSESIKSATNRLNESISNLKRKHPDSIDEAVQVDGQTESVIPQPDALPEIDVAPPPKRRRGRQPRNASASTPVGAATSAGLLAVPTAKPKRPPGRPRKTPVSAEGSEVPDQEKKGKKIPGRKRIPNPDARIERLLVRQAEIRRSYRTLAKAIKPALIELADRSLQTLQEDPRAHKKVPQASTVQKALDSRLNERLGLVEREYQLKRKNLVANRDNGKQIVRNDFMRKYNDLQEDFIIKCKDAYMKTLRGIRAAGDSDATDEEDPVSVRRPGPLDGTSRSWFFNDTERVWGELETRAAFNWGLIEYAPDVSTATKAGFATFDPHRREFAIAFQNVETLALATEVADATEAAERETTRKASENARRLGGEALEMLASLDPATDGRANKSDPKPGTAKAGSGSAGSPSKRPGIQVVTPERGVAAPPRTPRGSTKAAAVEHEFVPVDFDKSTQRKRPEPKMGLFTTPQTSASVVSSRLQKANASPISPSKKPKKTSTNSTNQPRTQDFKFVTMESPQRRSNSSNPLSNILNATEPPPAKAATASTKRDSLPVYQNGHPHHTPATSALSSAENHSQSGPPPAIGGSYPHDARGLQRLAAKPVNTPTELAGSSHNPHVGQAAPLPVPSPRSPPHGGDTMELQRGPPPAPHGTLPVRHEARGHPQLLMSEGYDRQMYPAPPPPQENGYYPTRRNSVATSDSVNPLGQHGYQMGPYPRHPEQTPSMARPEHEQYVSPYHSGQMPPQVDGPSAYPQPMRDYRPAPPVYPMNPPDRYGPAGYQVPPGPPPPHVGPVHHGGYYPAPQAPMYGQPGPPPYQSNLPPPPYGMPMYSLPPRGPPPMPPPMPPQYGGVPYGDPNQAPQHMQGPPPGGPGGPMPYHYHQYGPPGLPPPGPPTGPMVGGPVRPGEYHTRGQSF